MERDELRTTLVNHLETLRRNLQVVSMEVLKTKYKKPFDALRQDICKAATAYTRFLVFDGILVSVLGTEEQTLKIHLLSPPSMLFLIFWIVL